VENSPPRDVEEEQDANLPNDNELGVVQEEEDAGLLHDEEPADIDKEQNEELQVAEQEDEMSSSDSYQTMERDVEFVEEPEEVEKDNEDVEETIIKYDFSKYDFKHGIDLSLRGSRYYLYAVRINGITIRADANTQVINLSDLSRLIQDIRPGTSRILSNHITNKYLFSGVGFNPKKNPGAFWVYTHVDIENRRRAWHIQHSCQHPRDRKAYPNLANEGMWGRDVGGIMLRMRTG
jgi:hypothetical protein